MNYSLHPEAQAYLRDAAEFYRDRAGKSLSQSFLAEIRTIDQYSLAAPRIGFALARPWSASLPHEALFPYSLANTVSGEEIHILAIAHQSRRPGYWRGRK